MKKLLLFLIVLIFLAVSCSSSKKAENDADILPDEDDIDEDAADEDDEEPEEPEDDDNVPDDDGTSATKPCEPNPCENFANVDGTCTNKKDGSFECGCIEGYFWGHLGCKKLTFANVCTGQNKCYYGDYYDTDAMQRCPSEDSVIYGQDAQYAELGFCAPRRFRHNDDETVTDKNLGIEWTETVQGQTMAWNEADEYCKNLDLAGHDDWRLPLPTELLAANTDREYPSSFWSSVSQKNDDSSAWIMNKEHRLEKRKKENSFWVHCVRGEPISEYAAETPLRIIEINNTEIISDTDTQIFWQDDFSKEYRWTEALTFCERSTFAGFSDWRLPNINELTSLINHRNSRVSDFPIPKDLLEINPNFWTSTTNTYATWEPQAYAVNLQNGIQTGVPKDSGTTKARALCMRNEPCKKGFWWNGEKCVENPCKDDPCKNMAHSDGICGTEDFKGYFCGCDENYFWDGKECAKNPCEPNPCGDYEHTTGECTAPNRIAFICSCEEGYWWWGKNDGCVKERPHQRRVCTGQTKCYDMEKEIECPAEGEDFYGQDAQYAALGLCAPQNYSVDDSYEDEPIVTDINTGLDWQQKSKPVDHISWNMAQTYCDNLDYGGYSDWRLPTFYELQTLINYDGSPTIDMKYFPDTPPENFISSTFIYGGGEAGIVDFENAGLSSFLMSDIISGEVGISSSVRCVRGEVFEEDRGSLHTVSYEDGFLYTNHTTNLIWTRFTPEYYYEKNTWQERMKYCEDLDFAGFSDWRLPNVHELNSISLEDRWLRYGSSSTSMPWHPAEHFADASYKDETDHYYVCIRENPCTDGKLWDHGKCVDTVCIPNPCEEIENSYGGCSLDSSTELGFICGCNDGYLWDGTLVKCVFKTDRCNPNPCLEVENSTGECLQPGPYEQNCVCAEGYHWDGWNDICVKNSDGE